jgi:hypothetical protein
LDFSELKSWLIASTVLSFIIAFVLNIFKTNKVYGSTYSNTILKTWGQIFITLLPIIIYSTVSAVSHGWSKIFQSPEIAIASFLIFLFACNDLCGSLSINHTRKINPVRVNIISMWSLLWLSASLISVVLIFQATTVTTPVIIWQIVLLVVSVVTFFATSAVVNLIRNGYWFGAKKI